MAIDVYQLVTDRILEVLEQGVIPWQKPWTDAVGCISHVTGKRYSVLNQLMLGRSGEWLSFKQAQKEGGHIRKGEKGRPVVFFKFLDREDKDEETSEVKINSVPLLKYYTVFHIDQCEGIKPRFPAPENRSIQPDAAADQIVSDYVARSGVTISSCESDRAFYRPATDSIIVPKLGQYTHIGEYYSTLFHEMTHSTGHSSRLNRLDNAAAFGSEVYSKEELVAEIGAAYLVNHVGLETSSSFRNSSAYIQSWLRELKNDKRLIVSAAGKAEKAVRFILGDTAENEAE